MRSKTKEGSNNMRKEDKEISYRPKLAQTLSAILNTMNNLYKQDYRKQYYSVLSLVYKDADKKKSEFFKDVSKCFNGSSLGQEQFCEAYEPVLKKEYGIEAVSEARAASMIYVIYEGFINEFKDNLIKELSGLSKI